MYQSDFRTRIMEYAKAGYSGISVQTQEYERVKNELLLAASGLNRGFRLWRCTTGWLEASVNKNTQTIEFVGEATPQGGPEGIAEIAEGPLKTIYVMEVFDEMWRDPNSRQMMRDVLGPAREQGKVVVLIGTFTLPIDLDKEFATVEFDLPDRDALKFAAEDMLGAMESAARPTQEELGRVVDGALGLTNIEAQNAFALSLVRYKKLDVESVIETKKDIVRKSGILTYVDTEESLDTVGGLDELKGWITSRSAGFTEEARKFGLVPPKGILLCGVPGCGKSLVGKAISAAWQLPLLNLDMGRVFGSLVGQSEAQLRSALRTAEALAPAVLFVDEFEKAVSGMGGSSTDGGTTQRVMGSFLTWMQDRPQDKPVFVIATANNVMSLPPEMLRKGRWDELFFVDLPSPEEREEIFKIHLSKVGRNGEREWDYNALATVTTDFTGSEIEEVVKSALWKAFSADRDVTIGDLNEAARETIPLARGPMKAVINALRDDQRFRAASSRQARGAAASPGRTIEA